MPLTLGKVRESHDVTKPVSVMPASNPPFPPGQPFPSEQKHFPGSRDRRGGRHAIVMPVDRSNAGIFLVVVGGALFALLVLGGRAGRGIAREIWGRIGFFRWILILIIVVIILDLADGVPNQ
jgi:hypothetical protein